MAVQNEPRHRLTVEVDKEVYDELRDLIPWGTMKPIINIMLRDLLILLKENDPKMVLGAILSENITLQEYINRSQKEKEDG